jgi:spectinomycin phosphotransferase
MFTKKEYWDIFIEHYNKLRPEFNLDNDIFMFYILRRKIEDIWAFIESILYDNLSEQQRERDLSLLSECCNSLGNLYFEL